MTETTSTSPPSSTSMADDDPRSRFASIVTVTGDLIATTDPTHMSYATPCAEYTVQDLIGHLVAVLQRIAVVGRGEDPFSVP